MIYCSTVSDPYENQCIEEAFLQKRSLGPVHTGAHAILFIWQNTPTVFVGRNQIPWYECHLAAMQQDGVTLCRRISGGGAVFHDEHTVSLSYVTERAQFKKQNLLAFLQHFLQSYGIATVVDDRYNLFLPPRTRGAHARDDVPRKIVGSAFRIEKNRAVHHVSILFDCDETCVWRYLRKDEVKYSRTHATVSHRSAVGELASRMRCSVKEFLHELTNIAGNFFSAELQYCSSEYIDSSLRQHRESWDWIIGATPRHHIDVSINNALHRCEIHEGRIHACYNLLNGRIVADILGQALFTEIVHRSPGSNRTRQNTRLDDSSRRAVYDIEGVLET